jgi:hypothetical protein
MRFRMDFANFWLPIVGSILLGGFAVGAIFSNHKVAGLWFGFFGVVCLLLLATLQIQAWLEEPKKEIGETEQARLRAYISLNAQLGFFGTEQPIAVQVTITNSGQTPANDVKSSHGAGLRRFPTDEELPVFVPNNSPDVINPGRSIYSVVKLRRSLTQEEVDAVRAGKAAVVAVGTITYVDIFDRLHTCSYQFYYGGDGLIRQDGMMAIKEKHCD